MIDVDEARALYAAGDAAHDFDHVLRVTTMAVFLARCEGADIATVRTAALLHDAPTGASRGDHHIDAAEFAHRLLVERGADPDFAQAVAHCIRSHRFRDSSTQPQTLEARVLYDADKLDSMGAIGVARAFAWAGAHASRLWTVPVSAIEMSDAADGNEPLPSGRDYTPAHEYVFKLRRLLSTLYTPAARRLGEARHRTMVSFFAALDEEMAQNPDG